MKPAALSVFALIAAAMAGPAAAQLEPALTLYAGPNFQGPSKSFGRGIDSLASAGFNDKAMSARVQGRWKLCQNRGALGRCVEVTGDVADLRALNMASSISSFELLGRAENGHPFSGFAGVSLPGLPWRDREPAPAAKPVMPGRPGAGRSLEGRTIGFFPEPTGGRDPADFCRSMGFSSVVYADASSGAARDVVCRRQP